MSSETWKHYHLCGWTKWAKCDFLSVKVATKVFVHLLIMSIFPRHKLGLTSWQKHFSTNIWWFLGEMLCFRQMNKRMREKVNFTLFGRKSRVIFFYFQLKMLWEIIIVETPCGKNVSTFHVHIVCRYEVINLREPSTKRAKCDFRLVKVATKVFVHWLIFNIFPWHKA